MRNTRITITLGPVSLLVLAMGILYLIWPEVISAIFSLAVVKVILLFCFLLLAIMAIGWFKAKDYNR